MRLWRGGEVGSLADIEGRLRREKKQQKKNTGCDAAVLFYHPDGSICLIRKGS